jgi:hypothetical protein
MTTEGVSVMPSDGATERIKQSAFALCYIIPFEKGGG